MERSSACEAEPDGAGCLRASWEKELLLVEALKGSLTAGEHPFLEIRVCTV